jgi:hypothetical protein
VVQILLVGDLCTFDLTAPCQKHTSSSKGLITEDLLKYVPRTVTFFAGDRGAGGQTGMGVFVARLSVLHLGGVAR